MPFRVSFNLDDDDLRHFEEVAQQTQAIARELPADSIVTAARAVLDSGERAHVAAFMRERFTRLRTMIDMASDPDWQPRAEDRQRVLNALACFSAPSKDASSVGVLDHGIMIELVSRDLEHDIQAYEAFCKFRDTQLKKRRRPGADQDEQRDQWLAQKREELHGRMRERRRRDLDKVGSSVRKLFSLFGL